MSQPGVLQLDGLCCEVEKFTVFRDLNLSFQPGAIHGVLGQNGAGKTTLLNLLAGVSRPSGGGIFLDGRPLRFRSPHDAVAAGIRMSAQEETLIPDLSVAENMLFGQYGCGKAGILKHRKLEREMQELLDRLGIPLRAQTPVAKLDYGSRQMLKIACLLLCQRF